MKTLTASKVVLPILTLALLSLACSLSGSAASTPAPVASEPPTEDVGSPAETLSLEGQWTGTLEDSVQSKTYSIAFSIQSAGEGVYDGVFEISETGERYSVRMTVTDNRFQFSESGGHYFWGTISRGTLNGFVAWECYDCEYWGAFTLTRSDVGNPPASEEHILRFPDLSDGVMVMAARDTATGLPTLDVRADILGAAPVLALQADGLQVQIYDNTRTSGPNQITLRWSPWHGNGEYTLTLEALDRGNHRVLDSVTARVEVAGIPEGTLTIQERFTKIFRENLGLTFTAPPFARFSDPFPNAPDESRWVSAVYYNNKMYEAAIFDNGFESFMGYDVASGDNGFCRPAGSLKMLMVIVDYGNVPYDLNTMTSLLEEAGRISNQRWADYSSNIGLPAPILQVETTIAFAGAPVVPGQTLTSEQILARTGYNTHDFHITTEVDIDANNSVAGQAGGLGLSMNGGCHPAGSQRVNIAMSQVAPGDDIRTVVGASIYDHELMHGMGWMHWWPNGKADNLGWLDALDAWTPYLLFGWTDTDGDGVVEILDTATPYGLTP